MDRQSIIDSLKTLQDTADDLFAGTMDTYQAALVIEGSVAALAMDLNIQPEQIGLTLGLPCVACGNVDCNGHCMK